MQIALAQRGTHVSLRTVYRTMSEAGLIHRHRRPHGITKADTATQDKENLIKRNFTADAPLKKLLTDITEVQCADGKLYVSPILDCFNGEIVALEMRDNMKKELCIRTVKELEMLYGKKLKGTIFHSDRGSQYTSEAFRNTLRDYVCDVCGYVYDVAAGDPDNGIAPGTAWEDVPEDWVCPLCGVGKDQFSEE